MFSVFDPSHAYAYQCSAYSTAIFLFGGLIDYSNDKAVNAAFILFPPAPAATIPTAKKE